MAKYNTFCVSETKNNKIILVTSSARKADFFLKTGKRIDIWNNNKLVNKVYNKNRSELNKYIEEERDYIRSKQNRHERHNKACANRYI